MASEQKERTVQRVLVGHEVVRGDRIGKDLIPLKRTVLEPFPSAIFQKVMGSLEFSVSLRVVGTGEHMVKIQHLGDLTEQLVLEFGTIVSEDTNHAAFTRVEMRDETASNVISTLVSQWDRPQVAGQHVHDGQGIFVAGRRFSERANEVHHNELQWLRRDMKVEGVVLLGNTVHLLAVWAPFACVLDVMKHAGPPK